MAKTKTKERVKRPGYGSSIRISDVPVELIQSDGTPLTLVKGKGRFRVVLVTHKPLRSKRCPKTKQPAAKDKKG